MPAKKTTKTKMHVVTLRVSTKDKKLIATLAQRESLAQNKFVSMNMFLVGIVRRLAESSGAA